MRIAIIAPPWLPIPPGSYGGTETVIDTLARGLVQAGHEVLLWTTGDSTCPVPRGWTLEKAPGIAPPEAVSIELCHVVTAYEAIREQGIEVVHDHTLAGALHAASLPDLAVLTTNHGPFAGDLAPLYRAVGHRVGIIAISAHHASTAGDTPIAAVIPHGVVPGEFPVGSGRGGYAAFIGRMHPDKGVHLAARAARRSGVPMRIAAKMREPAERAYFEAAVEPLLGGGVEYLGEVGGTDKMAFLGEAVCLVNPILWPEPFGMVMIEAMACGTPVVARPVGSAPEIVEDGRTGFLAPDEDSLAAAIARAGELDRAACRRTVEERYSDRRMVEDHVAAYSAAARRRDPIRAA